MNYNKVYLLGSSTKKNFNKFMQNIVILVNFYRKCMKKYCMKETLQCFLPILFNNFEDYINKKLLPIKK